MKPIRFNPLIVLGLILAGVTACYWGVLENGYVWDDRISFVDYPQLMSWEGLKQGLSNPSLFFPANYYRPLTSIQLYMELRIAEREPWLLHAVSLLIHLANTALVFLLGRRLVTRFGAPGGNGEASRTIPWLAAAIYGFHPALTESVSWIAARSDLTVSFFLLACMVLGIGRATPLRVLALALLFFCAGLSKESAIVLPILFVLIDAFGMRQARLPLKALWADRAPVYGAVLLGGMGVLVVRYLGMGYLMAAVDAAANPLAIGSAIQHALLVGQALFAYLRAALVPFDTINPFHAVTTPVVITDPWPWIQSLAGLAAVAGCVFVLLRGSVFGLMGALYAAALLPVLQIITLPISGNLYHERYMTLPLAFMALGIAFVVAARVARVSFKGVVAVWTGVACWTALAMANVLVTVPLWRTDFTLWSWVVKRNPESFIARHNLAGAYLSAGEYEKASELNQDLLRRHPGHYLPLVNLGVQAIRENRLDEAVAYLEQAIQSPYGIEKSYYAIALGNLGYAEAARGNLDLAEMLLSEAIRIGPGLVDAVSDLSLVQGLKGNAAGAQANRVLALSYVPPKERPAFAAKAERRLIVFRDAMRRTAQSPHSQR
jgi:hypothetical protein